MLDGILYAMHAEERFAKNKDKGEIKIIKCKDRNANLCFLSQNSSTINTTNFRRRRRIPTNPHSFNSSNHLFQFSLSLFPSSSFYSSILTTNTMNDDILSTQAMLNMHDDFMWWEFPQNLDCNELANKLNDGDEVNLQSPSSSSSATTTIETLSPSPSKTKSIPKLLDLTRTKKRSEPKKNYRCNCKVKYPHVWKVNSSTMIKLCKICKKAQMSVKCNSKKLCTTCTKLPSPKECEISLKFRKYAIGHESFGSKKSVLCIHVLQNVFQRFNVETSCKKIMADGKQEEKRSSSSSSSGNDNSNNHEVEEESNTTKGNLEMLVSSNEDKLPFTWIELKNMKLISQQKV